MHCPEDMSPGTGAPAAPAEGHGPAAPVAGAGAPVAGAGTPVASEVELAPVAGAVALAPGAGTAPGAVGGAAPPAGGVLMSMASIGGGLEVEAAAWAAAATKTMNLLVKSMLSAVSLGYKGGVE